MVNILDQKNSILGRFMAEMRDEKIQKDSMRFRRNLERVGEILAYEISKTLSYSPSTITTPLGESQMMLSDDQVVLAMILRSGVPMMDGFLNYFDRAEVAFVSAHRHYRKNGDMEIIMQQVTTPELGGKTLILIDPMLATGQSIEIALEALIERGGMPSAIHICAAIASTDGIEYVESHMGTHRATIWAVSVDSDMTVKNYIVPGIGDTGDLAYGEKI